MLLDACEVVLARTTRGQGTTSDPSLLHLARRRGRFRRSIFHP